VYPVYGVSVAETIAEPALNLILASTVKDSRVETVPPVEPDGAEILKPSTVTLPV
jgi:hypothetical protein